VAAVRGGISWLSDFAAAFFEVDDCFFVAGCFCFSFSSLAVRLAFFFFLGFDFLAIEALP
jgi:hypothetical protein